MATEDKKLIRITGQVIERKTKQGLSNLRVEAWDNDLIVKEPFITAVTDQQGSFIIEFKKGRLKDFFGNRQAMLFFKVFRDANLIAGTQDSVIWSQESPDQEIIIQVETSEPPPDKPKKQKPMKISGKIRRRDGSLLGQGIVRAFITTADGENLIGETEIDSTGSYGITSAADEALPQQADALLQVRVFDKKGAVLAASSSTIETRSITMDLTVETSSSPADPSVVHGQILQLNKKPLDSGIVRIFGVVPAPQLLLGEQTITKDDEGRYRIEYQPGDQFNPIIDTTRVQVRVFRVVDGQELLLNPVSTLFRANPDELVDITLSVNVDKPPDQPRTLKVSGVITKDHQPLAGAIVKAFDGDLSGTLLGVTQSSDRVSDKGHYEIRYTVGPAPNTISHDPALLVAVYGVINGLETLLKTSAIVPSGGQDRIIDVDIPVTTEPPDPGTDVTYTVVGTVTSPDRGGVNGLRVQIVDRNIGPDVFLAETVTDENGNYKVSFVVSPASLKTRCKQNPDPQARAFAGNIFLAASEVRYFASTLETLNVTLPANSAALPSEYEMLISAIARHCGGILDNLQESDDRQDITYLASKTGWDARAIALAALAEQFSRSAPSALPPAVFYALFRAGLPANDDILYRTDAGTISAILNKAIEQSVIPKSLAGIIPQAAAQFQIASALKLLTGAAVIGTSSLNQMLDLSGLTNVQKTKFAELYVAHRDDTQRLWAEVSTALGVNTANRLQVDGKLGFLTINNAPLIQAIHSTAGSSGISDPLQLAQQGFHNAAKWTSLLTSSVSIPSEVPGDTSAAKKTNYAEYLAAQVRLSYPTASVAQMVGSGDLPLTGSTPGISTQVRDFLNAHQGNFEIGMQPVQQYIKLNNVSAPDEIVKQVSRLQRVLQITPSDQAMIGLMKNGINSAYQVVRHEKDAFVQTFALELGGPEAAEQTYDKAVQVHNAALNIAVSYLTAKNGIALGAGLEASRQASDSSGFVIQPTPITAAGGASDVIAFPTLEGLFGEMDFCACDHCRSVLSPAAYLVDLLLFLDREDDAWVTYLTKWRLDHGNAPYPFGSQAAWIAAGQPADTENTPLQVLLSRRPDLQHLPLTCENTNTALPYIDVVNETLEYFIANTTKSLSLNGYVGHDTDGLVSADLLASPQFVIDSAYAILSAERSVLPLPFHKSLEGLRRYFEKFEVALPMAMERLRKSDALERGANAYGWRDILIEELRLSRDEYQVLSDSNAVPFWRLFGFPNGTSDADIINGNAPANIPVLSNAKQFTRRAGITFEDIAAILQTRFVNPGSDLIPKLERLGIPFATLKALNDGTITDAAFDALLPTGAMAPDPAAYGGNIKEWIRDDANFDRIKSLITLTDPTGSADPCNFDTLEFRFLEPSTRLRAVEFFRILRFIRLWKKLGWTIEQTDAAICALFRADLQPLSADDIDTLAELDAGFSTLLPRLGIVVRVMRLLNLTPKRDLPSVLALWSPIGTHGDSALYRQMFLNPAILTQDEVFADNGFGEFLTDPTKRVGDHAGALRSAFNLTGDEFDRIFIELAYDENTPLTVPNVSAIFRRGYLARKLKLSVHELLSLTSLTGLDPFAAPDVTDPAILRLIALIQAMKDRSLKSAAALYLIWNQDLSGKSVPDPAQVASFARTLRLDFAAVETEFAITDDPDGAIAQARMALVYGADAAAFFFGLLNDTLTTTAPYSRAEVSLLTSVSYDQGLAPLDPAILAVAPALIAYDSSRRRLSFNGAMTTATRDELKAVTGVTQDFKDAVDNLYAENQKVINANLEQAIVNVAPGRIAYDNFRKLLSYAGVLTATTRDALRSAAALTLSPQQKVDDFNTALDKLDAENQKSIGPFFARYPELKSFYDAHANDPAATRRSMLLNQILPDLLKRRKAQQALQAVSAAAQTDLDFARVLLDASPIGIPLHAAGQTSQPALNDFLALETVGLSVQFFASGTISGTVIPSEGIAANLDYAPVAAGVGNPLPTNPTLGAAISGIWSGYLEAPESGFFNLLIETDPSAIVALKLGGEEKPLTQEATLWRNTVPIELRAGTLYAIELKVENVRDIMRVQWEWEPKGQGRTVIPPRYLYPAATFEAFRQAYVRFLKASALATTLRLTASEMAHFGTYPDYRINAQGEINSSGEGWLNVLPSADNLHLTNPAEADIARRLNATLLIPLRELLDYARIKAAISPDDESLLIALRNPAATLVNGDSLLLTVTQWDKTSLCDLLAHFTNNADCAGSITGLTNFNLLRRVYDAFALIQKMGISAKALITATTNEPTGDTVRDFQAALRARYDSAAWRDVVQPINDAMRGLQRDALVAYILHQMRSNPATRHIDTADKLFEYFLMDVQMEPCMQTSRVRHALSSAQLFIERSLMNLEPRVAPAAINGKQWEWMKRYRVWEANRKVFLFPENWLEPELRDDKSPFFKEIESELLQSDITEDSATSALVTYLSKLEEVAKLEPCGIYHIPADPSLRTGEIDHVIARTAGGKRKYYYRRFEFGYWTPWEQIKLDIEDNPVTPFVWKGRLLLFWLRILKQAPVDPNDLPDSLTSGRGPVITQLELGHIKNDAKTTAKNNLREIVQAVLCWSEYYNGKWQPTKTSDVGNPSELGRFVPGAFNRSNLRLSAAEEGDALRVRASGEGRASFLLYNTHTASLPDATVSAFSPVVITARSKTRDLNTSASDFIITNALASIGLSAVHSSMIKRRPVLTNPITDRTVAPLHRLTNTWDAPFFYEDSRHVFFVTVTEHPVLIADHSHPGIVFNPNFNQVFNLPSLIVPTGRPNVVRPTFTGDGDPISPDVGNINPGSIQRFVTEDAYIHRALGTAGGVTYGSTQIGPSGAIPAAAGSLPETL